MDFEEACAELEATLLENGWCAGRQERSWLINRYRPQRVSRGWRIVLGLDDGSREELDLIVGSNFPRALPVIGLPHDDRALVWPHANSDRTLCVIPPHEAETLDARFPGAIVVTLVKRTKQLLTKLRARELDQDFVIEWDTYWRMKTVDSGWRAVSLLTPHAPSRMACAFEGGNRIYVGELEGEGALTPWLKHLLNDTPGKREVRDAVFIWLQTPLMPEAFPEKAEDVRQMARAAEVGDLLEQVHKKGVPYIVVFGFDTEHGPALGAVQVGDREHRVAPGRARKVPGLPTIRRLMVDRADREWIHVRGGEGLQGLQHKHVVMLGCGSLGAPVAHLLAQSGLGRLTLIDPQQLSWDNVGRYPDGGKGAVGRQKARQLAERLQGRLPHLQAVALNERWQAIWGRSPDVMRDADLVLSTMAIWVEEAYLNALARRDGLLPPLLFGWMEGHAAAGHAVLLTGRGGCLACRASGTGSRLDQVVDWGDTPVQRRAPGCAALYSPYGPVELAPIHGMIAGAALDMLNGRIRRGLHRVWLGDQARIKRLGGRWTAAWSGVAGDGNRLVSRLWVRRSDCSVCRGS